MTIVTPVRVGIWFDPAHIPYGGPAQVLIGTILGLLQDSENPRIVLLNEAGDLNWAFDKTDDLAEFDLKTYGLKRAIGPAAFNHADHHVKEYESHQLWKLGRGSNTVYLSPSVWYAKWISHALPFHELEKHRRPMIIWCAGVDTEKFRPLVPRPPKFKHSYFVYFKSQDWTDIEKLHSYLFENYFKLHGPILTYYFHTQEELLEAAQNSRFCIYVGIPETQGLASLEIMSCDCPLFIIDCNTYVNGDSGIFGVTSVTCWDEKWCGMKSSLANIANDFPLFMKKLDSYRPREFVEKSYSWKKAAGMLCEIIDTVKP